MKVFSEISLSSFEFWGGAKLNADMLSVEELEQLDYMLEDCYSEGVSETLINDIMWFEFEWVCEMLGYEYDVENDVIIR